MIQRPQNRVAQDRVAVAQHPLQFADPHRDAGQFGGVGVELDAQHVGGAGVDADLALQAEGFGFEVGAVFQILEGFQREVEEVARSACGIKHAVGFQVFQIADEGGMGFLVGSL